MPLPPLLGLMTLRFLYIADNCGLVFTMMLATDDFDACEEGVVPGVLSGFKVAQRGSVANVALLNGAAKCGGCPGAAVIPRHAPVMKRAEGFEGGNFLVGHFLFFPRFIILMSAPFFVYSTDVPELL